MTSTDIMEMVRCCSKLTHLSLPKSTQLTLDHVEDIVRTMTYLQELDVFANEVIQTDHMQLWNRYYRPDEGITRLLKATEASVKKLVLRFSHSEFGLLILSSLREWVNVGNSFPSVINLLTNNISYSVTSYLFQFWLEWNSKPQAFAISLYEINRVPVDLYPSMPVRKFQFGPAATPPFIKLSDHGILGLKYDTFYLSEYDHCGEVIHALTPKFFDPELCKVIEGNLKCISITIYL